MKNWLWILLAVLFVAALTVFIRKRKYLNMENAVWDKISEDRINTLHPLFRDKVRAFINAVEKELGVFLRVVEGARSFERSDALYNQPRDGKDNDGDGQIDEPDEKVTDAKGGSSFHNFALAIDVVPIVGGKADFKTPHWAKIAAIGKRFGMRWGGDFKKINDKPHFEYSFGKTLAQLQALYAARKVDKNGFVNLV